MPKVVRLVEREVDFRSTESMGSEGNDGRMMEGYASVFGSPTRIHSWEGEFDEQIAKGAFRKTIQERTPLVQYDHGKDARVGSTPIAAIQELREDDEGLFIQARLFDNPVVEPVRQAIEGRALRGMSFRFQVMRDEWRDNAGKLVRAEELGGLLRDHGGRGPLQRTVKEVQLLELGPVAFPAYASTSVGVRAALDELTDDERARLIAELAGDSTMSDEEIAEMQKLMSEDDERDDKAGYSVVADHGCGEGKYAVVDKATGKNESCHPDEETAKAHMQKKMGGGGDDKKGPPFEKKSAEEYSEGDVVEANGTGLRWIVKSVDGDMITAHVENDEDNVATFPASGVKRAKAQGGSETNKADLDTDNKKKYGDVTYADPEHHKYPVDTAAHVKAAWSYINTPKNQGGYSPEQLAAIKGRIKSAAKKLGVEIGGDSKPAEKKPVEKKSLAPTSTVTPERKAAKRAPSTARKERAMAEEQMTVEERVSRQSEIRARLSEIDTEYNGAALPEDVQEEWDSINQEHDDHDVAIEAATVRAEQLRRLAVDDRSTERAGERRKPTARRRPDNIYDLNEIRSGARSVDELGTLYRDNAMRAIEQAKFGGRVNKEDAQSRAEQLMYNVDDVDGDVKYSLSRRILTTGSPLYERAWGKAVRGGSMDGLNMEERAALSLGSDPAGGFAVPFQLDPTVILDTDGVINPLRQMARVVQITGKKWQGVTTTGVTVSRSNEASEVAANEPVFAQPEVNATRVTGFVPFSVELESTWSALRSEITNILNDAKAEEEANSFLNGDGTGLNPGGVAGTLDAGSYVYDMGTFGSEDIYALEEALPPRYRNRGQFLANKSTYNAVRQFGTTDGADLWVRLGARTPGELIGYQANEASEMTGAGAAGTWDGYLMFGDFQHFIIVDRIGMSVELVPHLFGTVANRPTGQRGVLAIWSNGSEILVQNAFRMLVHGSS